MACPRYRSEYLKNTGDLLKKYIAKYKAEDLTVAALVVLKSKLKDPGKINLLDAVVSKEFSGISQDYYSTIDKIELNDLNELLEVTMVNDIYNAATTIGLSVADAILPENPEGPSTDNNTLNESLRSPGINIGQAVNGTKTFDAFYISAIGERLERKQYKNLINAIESAVDFEDFLSYVGKTFKNKDIVAVSKKPINKLNKKQSIKRRNLLLFYTVNRQVNKIPSASRNRLIYANLDPSVNIKSSDDVTKAISGTVGRFLKKIGINLNTKTKTPDNEIASFLDSSERTIRGERIQDVTTTFSLSEIVEIKKRNDGGWWAQQKTDSKSINIDKINQWSDSLLTMTNQKGYPTPLVIVAMTPGDSGQVFTAKVRPSVVEQLFPRNVIIQRLIDEKVLPAKELAKFNKQARSIVSLLQLLKKEINAPRVTQIKGQKPVYRNDQFLYKKAYDSIVQITREIGSETFKNYISSQVEAGNMTKDQANILYNQGKSTYKTRFGDTPMFPMHLASMVAKHEWLQAVRGNNYLMGPKGDNALNIFDRLRLNMSKGLQTEGIGPSRHIMYDQNKVEYWYKGEKFEHLRDIPGIKGLVNIFDGGSFSSGEYLDNTADNIGVYPVLENEHNLREVKTVYQEVTIDEETGSESYIEKKHAEHVAIDGLEITEKRKDGKKGNTIVQMQDIDGVVKIYSPKYNQWVDEVGDMDVFKTNTGIYDLKNDSSVQFDLQESSRRIIITPHTKSPEDTYGPTQYLQSLNFVFDDPKNKEDKENLDNYKKAMLDIVLSQSDLYIDQFLDAGRNPDILWNMVAHLFTEKTDIKSGLQKMLVATKGAGVYHSNNLMQLKPMLLNMLMRKGAMQGRTYNTKLYNRDNALQGSQYVMKPGREVERGKVILSKENHSIWDAVVKKSGLGVSISLNPKDPTVEEVNEWLKTNEVNVLTFRAPVLQISALETRNIQEFVEDEGNAIYHHPEDTFVRLVGDHDIDKASTILLDNKQAKQLNKFYETPWYKEVAKTTNADIGIFETPKQFSILDDQGTKQAMVNIINGYSAQGQAANLKAVASTLSAKFKRIVLSEYDADGNPIGGSEVVLEPKMLWSRDSENQFYVMDYVPLRDDITQDDIPPYAEIVNKEGKTWKSGHGKKYLKTSGEHEFLLVANAAVDNLKTGLLTAGMGARNNEWYIDKMFNVIEGELTDKHYALLSKLKKEFNYSPLRDLRTKNTRKRMSIKKYYHDLAELHSKRTSSKEDQVRNIQESISEKWEIGGKQYELGFKEIEMRDDNITPEERVLIRPYEKLENLWEQSTEEQGLFPFLFDDERLELTHYIAADKLFQEAEKEFIHSFSSKAVEEGLKLAAEFSSKFYKSFEQESPEKRNENHDQDNQKEDSVIVKQAEFDERLFNLAIEYDNKISLAESRLGQGVRSAATLRFITGDASRKNIKYLPPVEVMDVNLLKKYMEIWDEVFMSRDANNEFITTNKSRISDFKGSQIPIASMIDKIRKKEC